MMDDDLAVSQLAALAQSTRFAVFRLLMKHGEPGLSAGDIAESVGVPQNSLSSHLKIMTNAGLIDYVRQGRSLIYAVNISGTRNLVGHLVNDCCNGHPEICDIATPLGKGC